MATLQSRTGRLGGLLFSAVLNGVQLSTDTRTTVTIHISVFDFAVHNCARQNFEQLARLRAVEYFRCVLRRTDDIATTLADTLPKRCKILCRVWVTKNRHDLIDINVRVPLFPPVIHQAAVNRFKDNEHTDCVHTLAKL